MKRKKASLLAAGLALVLMFAAGAVFATSASAKGDGPTAMWATGKEDGPTTIWATGDSGSSPDASVEEGSDLILSPEVAQSFLDAYGQYGLTYDETLQRLRYNGKLVRFFEDMYPVNADGSEKAGTVVQMPDGEVDVYSVRDLSNLARNADGSYDPSGQLTGLREATQEEFDSVTAQLAKNKMFVDRSMSYAGEATSVWEDDVELAEDSARETAAELVAADAVQAEDAIPPDTVVEEIRLQAEDQMRDAQEASKPQ